MELLTDTNPNESEFVKQFLNDVKVKEAECFDRVFTRFCLLNGVKIDIAKIDFESHPQRPNFTAYYYRGIIPKSNLQRHFLMSRDLIEKPGEYLPVLNITFNANLIDEKNEN